MPLTVGSRLGHYEITALIGEGGMGQVYQATDTKLKRQVALNVLPQVNGPTFPMQPGRSSRRLTRSCGRGVVSRSANTGW